MEHELAPLLTNTLLHPFERLRGRAKYGKLISTFAYSYYEDNPSLKQKREFVQIRIKNHHPVSESPTVISILDKNGERLAFVKGQWDKAIKGRFNAESSYAIHPQTREEIAREITEYNRMPPRKIPGVVKESIVNLVFSGKIQAWRSAEILTRYGHGMYKSLQTDPRYQDRISVAGDDDFPYWIVTKRENPKGREKR